MSKFCQLKCTDEVDILVDKSLIIITDNTFSVHDLLQEMALHIVRQESREPGKRSRLCLPEDIYQVLKHNTVSATYYGFT